MTVWLASWSRLLSISEQIFNFAESVVKSSGYAGVFALMVMESATLPVPSEVVLPLAGYLVYEGSMNFWLVVIVASIGSMIGTLIDYSIGFYLGRPAILKYGRYVRLNENHLKTSENWFNRYGNITVFLARFVPLIRTLVAFPAGIAEMKIWKFVAYSAVGIFAWDSILVYLGFLAGQNSAQIISALTSAFTPIEIVAVVIAVVALLVWMRVRGRRGRTTQPTSVGTAA